ncbi:sporulation integral membrane protein YtvI [Bacillus halotolerans]|uniref:sporulation integral membrane protein YtvI n=1 Tax=Bacillus halotolerans TaxID=260554 RepID=UPI00075082E3|nr:sporulation integral membrane protein YtvI [Bacillus halotolerans]KUP41519.1 sporulation integral membrane protein YtvI [Bacillus halotolerans]
MNQSYITIFFRTLFVVSLTAGSAAAVYYSFPLTYPFLIALILSTTIHPVVDYLDKVTGFPRTLNVIGVLAFFLLAAFGVLTIVVAEIVTGTAYLAKTLPPHISTFISYCEKLFTTHIQPLYHELTVLFHELETNQQASIVTHIQTLGDSAAKNAGLLLSHILEMIPKFFALLPNTAAVLIFSLLATFFMTKDWHKLKAVLVSVLPDRITANGKAISSELKKAMTGFIKAQAVLVFLTMVIVFIGLSLLKVEHAATIAFLIGLVDLLPYLGAGSVFVPWILYLSITGQLPQAIGIGVLYIVVLVQRQLTEPKILSKSIGIDPLATLIALFAGFKLFGFLGLIAGPAVLVVIQAFITTGALKEIWSYITVQQK